MANTNKYPRIDFIDAISDKRLLKKTFDSLAKPQQSALRIFYGLPLDEEGLRHLSMFRGEAVYDELGYVIDVKPATDYVPMEHDEAWEIIGRRGTKTSGFLAFILVYEALLGGHTQFRMNDRQQIASFIVAQKLDIAQAIIRDFIEPMVDDSPLLKGEISVSNIQGLQFKNGHRIIPSPPVIKNFRYFAIPVVALDECAFWYKDAESANPDFEVVRAATPAQAQFPYRKLIGASTVWTKEGIIWEAKQAGTDGRKLPDDDERKPRFKNVQVFEAPTPAMEAPWMDKLPRNGRGWFEKEFKKDPDAYRREILNMAVDAISGLFSELMLNQSIDGQPINDRDYHPSNYYIAAIDPAFRGDDFTFTIGHYQSEGGFYQDLMRKWTPSETKLNPSVILDEIKVDIDRYHVEMVFSDQYQLESLQQLALDRGFSIIGQDFTANSKSKLFGSFLTLMRNNRVHLLRLHDQKQQFLWVQRIIGHGGYVRISAPVGKHDDMVTVVVLCAAMAIRFIGTTDADAKPAKELTTQEYIMAQIMASKQPKKEKEWL